MREFIFIGGSGRSGTTFLTEAVGLNPRVVSFPSVELKFLTSREGLLDLRYCLVEEYNIDSAQQGLSTFHTFLKRVLFQTYFNPVPVKQYSDVDRLVSAVDVFLAAMRMNDRAAPQTPESFDSAALTLLDAIYAARFREEGSPEPLYNLEKTPHALLHMNRLHQIFPRSKFLHVMRDPRAIVLSLLKMDWAPNTVAECVTWIKCYCRAWERSRRAALANDVSLLEIRLEDIAADQGSIVGRLADFLNLEVSPDVFEGVRPDIAATWRKDCSAEDLRFMTEQLNDEIVFLGYSVA